MQGDGNLVIYALDGTAVWSTGTADNSGATFRLQRDRNLVLADSDNGLLWTSSTYVRKLSKVGDNTATSVHHERTRRLSSREDRHLKTTIQDDQDRRLNDNNNKFAPNLPRVRVTAITGCCTDRYECQGNQTDNDLPQTCSNPEPDACLPSEPTLPPTINRKYQAYDV